MSRFRIAPSILSADFGRLADEVRAAEQAGADWIHLDVMDGHFVPNLTIGPDVVSAVSKVTSLPRDVHLMVEDPARHVPAFLEAGASAIGVHVEACRHPQRLFDEIHARGARSCIVLNPETPASAVRPLLSHVDQVLAMTVNPGFGGQRLIPATLPKLVELRRWIDTQPHPIDLVVDGGIGSDTIEDVALHGANVFVMGAAFFQAPDYKRLVDEIRTLLAPYTSPPSSSEGP
ncbi:MAG: ribulose-phosphate 3-epimerase [Myxococcota bacterium]